jgi:hypothetical protein
MRRGLALAATLGLITALRTNASPLGGGAAAAAVAGREPKPWVNSTEGIHLFLTFDYGTEPPSVPLVQPAAKRR